MRTGSRYVPAIDGFRAYAVVAIVALHMLAFAKALPGDHGTGFEILAWGTLGNALAAFFIISGFSLMLGVISGDGEPGPLRRFYARRAVRIYPAYWLTLLVALGLMAIALPPPDLAPNAGVSSPAEVVAQFTGLQMPARMLDASMTVALGVDPVVWFVSVILGFYLLFPLIARPYAKHPLIGLALATAVSVAWVWAATHLIGIFTAIEGHHAAEWVVRLIAVEQLPGWAFSFGVGMTAAWAYVRLSEIPTSATLAAGDPPGAADSARPCRVDLSVRSRRNRFRPQNDRAHHRADLPLDSDPLLALAHRRDDGRPARSRARANPLRQRSGQALR